MTQQVIRVIFPSIFRLIKTVRFSSFSLKRELFALLKQEDTLYGPEWCIVVVFTRKQGSI